MISRETSLIELAFIVCDHLKNHQIIAVLTGGSAVSVYTQNRYQSSDLDFVSSASHKQIAAAVQKLGFRTRGRIFQHPENSLTLDFPSGPLAVGDEILVTWQTLTKNNDTLYILTPTQSVKDRLASYFYYDDLQCLDQAVWVAQAQAVDLAELESWSEREKNTKKFQDFIHKLDPD
ncbi:MAG: hypothetical protein KDC71_23165 [Acidobacteria bacterium]|nr:hypothetical protein [Acidobacteriota bacterium]